MTKLPSTKAEEVEPGSKPLSKMKEALEACKSFLESAPLESGYCMCGSKVEDHDMGSGHSPVDDVQYYVSNLLDTINEALNTKEKKDGKEEQDT